MNRKSAIFIAAATLTALLGCAPMVPSVPARLEPWAASASSRSDVRLPEAVLIHLSTGFVRALPAQSRWHLVGRLPQGSVYRPMGSVFSIEGQHVHEAYLVVRQDTLVGFYLPAEQRFSPQDPAIHLPKGVFE